MIDQDNYAGRSSWKTFSTLLSVLYNYFDSPTKLFSDLYLAKFVCTLAKSFRVYKAYVCIYIYIYIYIYIKDIFHISFEAILQI